MALETRPAASNRCEHSTAPSSGATRAPRARARARSERLMPGRKRPAEQPESEPGRWEGKGGGRGGGDGGVGWGEVMADAGVRTR